MRLVPGAPPHVHAGSRTPAFCWIVAACLAPAAGWGVLSYGSAAAVVLAAAVGSALLVELAAAGLRRRFTLDDGSAFLTGLLVGLSMPPGAPWYVAAAASGFAVAVVKQGFGGLGRNWMNPALAGRAFAALSWPGAMTAWLPTRFLGPDAVAAATPLAAARAAGGPGRATFAALASAGGPFSQADDAAIGWLNAHVLSPIGAAAPRGLLDLLAGLRAGAIGEASVLLLLAGAAVLLWRRIIRWEIPAALFGTFALLSGVLGGLPEGLFPGGVAFPLLTGGIVLAGFYMATDPVTSPMSRWGRIAFGALAGALTWLLRVFGGAPAGIGIAVLLANCLSPLLDRWTRPRRSA